MSEMQAYYEVSPLSPFEEIKNVETGGYLINEKGHHVWLQRLALWVLRRFGNHGYTISRNVKWRPTSGQKIIDRLFDQRYSMMKVLDPRRDQRIIMGPEDMAELMCDPSLVASSAMDMMGSYQHGRYPQAIGLPITVVPQIKGVFIMDDDRAHR